MSKPENDHLENQQKLEQENFLLKSKIIARGGNLDSSDNLSAEIENKFLENVMAIEDAPDAPVYKILKVNPEDFPPKDQLSQKQLKAKLDHLLEIMAEHNMFCEFAGDLPDDIAYNHLSQEFLFEVEQIMPDGWVLHINGCDGWCPDCFQLDYCTSWKDTWTEEELKKEQQKSKLDLNDSDKKQEK